MKPDLDKENNFSFLNLFQQEPNLYLLFVSLVYHTRTYIQEHVLLPRVVLRGRVRRRLIHHMPKNNKYHLFLDKLFLQILVLQYLQFQLQLDFQSILGHHEISLKVKYKRQLFLPFIMDLYSSH